MTKFFLVIATIALASCNQSGNKAVDVSSTTEMQNKGSGGRSGGGASC